MSEKDIAVSRKLVQDAIFDLNSLLKVIKSWYSQHRYELIEKEHDEFGSSNDKEIKIVLVANKKIDDYTKFFLNLTFTIKNAKKVNIKKANSTKNGLQANITIVHKAIIESDYDAKWEVKPWRKFWRGIQDKYFFGDKSLKKTEEIKTESDSLLNELKEFLKLNKI